MISVCAWRVLVFAVPSVRVRGVVARSSSSSLVFFCVEPPGVLFALFAKPSVSFFPALSHCELGGVYNSTLTVRAGEQIQ